MRWTDKNDKEWELWQMSDQHLHNVKNMVLRLADQLDDNACAAFGYPGQGDMATYYADCAGSAAMEQASEFRALAEAIDNEFDRRIAIWEKRKT